MTRKIAEGIIKANNKLSILDTPKGSLLARLVKITERKESDGKIEYNSEFEILDTITPN